MKLFLILCVFSLLSCKGEIKFDKKLWITKEYPEAPPEMRNKMLNDLTSNYKLGGISYNNLIDLLGEPNGYDNDSLFYDIVIDYGSDIDPVYTKTLSFKMNKDSIIESYKIDEWRK